MIKFYSLLFLVITSSVSAQEVQTMAPLTCRQALMSAEDLLQERTDVLLKKLLLAIRSVDLAYTGSELSFIGIGTDEVGNEYDLDSSDLVQALVELLTNFQATVLSKEDYQLAESIFAEYEQSNILNYRELFVKAIIEFNVDRIREPGNRSRLFTSAPVSTYEALQRLNNLNPGSDSSMRFGSEQAVGSYKAIEILEAFPPQFRSAQVLWQLTEIYHYRRDYQRAHERITELIQRERALSAYTIKAFRSLPTSNLSIEFPVPESVLGKINVYTSEEIESVFFDENGQWGPYIAPKREEVSRFITAPQALRNWIVGE